jgi:hypothetical protein
MIHTNEKVRYYSTKVIFAILYLVRPTLTTSFDVSQLYSFPAKKYFFFGSEKKKQQQTQKNVDE